MQAKIQITFKLQLKKEKNIEFRSSCPISSALDIVGDKWSLLIIRDLAFMGKKTFGDFFNSEEKIASNILSNRLKLLEESGIITKGKIPGNKKMNVYSLTEKGVDFLPVIVEYILWSDKYLSHIAIEAKGFAAMLKKDKKAIIEDTKRKIFGLK